MSAPRYEVRCGDGTVRSQVGLTAERARSWASDLNRRVPHCGPHTVWSIDPDGTETDITDESETT